jgi:hypothetical protein
MLTIVRKRLYDPVFLLVLASALLACVVQSGDLGSVDTLRRLQTTHSFWTSDPPVLAGDYPDFGLRGKDGRIYAWYGIGQSLLMLPTDIAGTYIEKLPIFADYNGNDPRVRDMVVSYFTNTLLNVLTVLVCLRFLALLGFSRNESIAGVLALLLCTTHLHYTQNMMENNYILLLTLIGFTFQYEWLRTGSRRELVIGATALGLNLLTRLTTGLDLMAAAGFLVVIVWLEGMRGKELLQKAFEYAKTVAPIYAVFLVADRIYQFHRFGSFTNTYITVFGEQQRAMHPEFPPNYPFEVPFHVGFFGALFTPEKSIFLFDPLLLLTILLVVLLWKKFDSRVKAYLITGFVLLLAYICFYARYTVWSGDSAWGDRYVSSAAQMVAFISVPLLMQYHVTLGKLAMRLGVVIIGVSLAVQLASLAFWLPLEIYQMTTLGHPTCVVCLRFKNIVAFSLGKMDQWGLTNSDMTTDPWDYVHITTWNFLPFVLRRVGVAHAWVVRVVFVLWWSGVVALAWTLWRLRTAVRLRGTKSSGRSKLSRENLY